MQRVSGPINGLRTLSSVKQRARERVNKRKRSCPRVRYRRRRPSDRGCTFICPTSFVARRRTKDHGSGARRISRASLLITARRRPRLIVAGRARRPRADIRRPTNARNRTCNWTLGARYRAPTPESASQLNTELSQETSDTSAPLPTSP